MNWKILKPVLLWGIVFYLSQTVIVLFIDLLIGVYAEDIVIVGINTVISGFLGYIFTPKLLKNKELSRDFTPIKLGGMLAFVAVVIEFLLNSLLLYNLNILRWILMIAASAYGGKLSSEKKRSS